MNVLLNRKTTFIDLGMKDYLEAWDYQTALFDKTLALKKANREQPLEAQVPTPNFVVFCQHPHVYTLGKSGSQSHLLLSNERLGQIGASFYPINRGGDITYHGPGQLVGYPILDLENFFTDIHKYMRLLEEGVILALADFGITAGRIKGLTGVWVDMDSETKARKICAFGVRTSRWVTLHGFALNVNTNLEYFNHIVPCGISDKAVTSMEKELGRKVDYHQVQTTVKEKLVSLFEMEVTS